MIVESISWNSWKLAMDAELQERLLIFFSMLDITRKMKGAAKRDNAKLALEISSKLIDTGIPSLLPNSELRRFIQAREYFASHIDAEREIIRVVVDLLTGSLVCFPINKAVIKQASSHRSAGRSILSKLINMVQLYLILAVLLVPTAKRFSFTSYLSLSPLDHQYISSCQSTVLG